MQAAEKNVWRKMKDRCRNPENKDFKYYGGKGIAVCQEWQDSYETFLRDMGPRPTPKHSIERLRGMEGYNPTNCVWATSEEQSRNRPGFVHAITFRGKTQTVAEWAVEMNLRPMTLYNRIKMGWSAERALTEAPKFARRNPVPKGPDGKFIQA